jgi:hypothetical protein
MKNDLAEEPLLAEKEEKCIKQPTRRAVLYRKHEDSFSMREIVKR